MFKIFLTKSILTIIPFLFFSYFLFNTENVNVWRAFGLQIGAFFGIILAKYIHQYGKKNAIIFGGILFSVFTSQFFITNQSITISIIILILAGFGYGIVCYEVFYDTQKQNIKIITSKQKTLFYIIFISFYVVIGIVLIANSFKMLQFYNSIFIFMFYIFYSIIIFFIERHKLAYKPEKLSMYLLLTTLGIWISAISTEVIVLIFGSIIIAILYGFVSQYRRDVFYNHSVINFQMLIGYIISGMIITLTNNIIDISCLYYLSFVLSALLFISIKSIDKYKFLSK